MSPLAWATGSMKRLLRKAQTRLQAMVSRRMEKLFVRRPIVGGRDGTEQMLDYGKEDEWLRRMS